MKHWSNYWESGVLTSLPQDFKKNYDGELASFWENIVSDLPAQADAIDLCTGNLALPVLLCQLSNKFNKKLNYTAVDIAKINKSTIINKNPELADVVREINIIDETSVEDLSEKIVGQVDIVTSQYGLEYCDTEPVAKKVYDLLKAEGQLVFVSHATDTDILKSMQEEKLAFDTLEDLKVLSLMKRYGEGRHQAAYFQQQINKQLKQLHKILLDKPLQLLQIFHQAMGGLSKLSLSQLEMQKEAIFNFYHQHWLAQMRANDLLTVSEKIANQPEWYEAFIDAGLVLKSKNSIWYQGKHNAGTAFIFRKPK